MKVTVGVFATILDGAGRALLIHRTDCDWWRQSGGGMESGETPWDGVIREARAETGFVVAVERLAGVYSWAPRKDEVIFSFACTITEGVLATSDESDDLPANTFPEHGHRLRDALVAQPETLLKVAQRLSSHAVARGRAAPEAG
jgi:ADP-ribose pyrophosphatase YjhB (NUDIX family)